MKGDNGPYNLILHVSAQRAFIGGVLRYIHNHEYAGMRLARREIG